MWLGEGQAQGGWRAEEGIEAEGYQDWRETAEPDNLDLIDLYAGLLAGQYAGMTDALSLEAVEAAMRIERIAEDDRPGLARRLIVLHSLVREQQRAKEGKK